MRAVAGGAGSTDPHDLLHSIDPLADQSQDPGGQAGKCRLHVTEVRRE